MPSEKNASGNGGESRKGRRKSGASGTGRRETEGGRKNAGRKRRGSAPRPKRGPGLKPKGPRGLPPRAQSLSRARAATPSPRTTAKEVVARRGGIEPRLLPPRLKSPPGKRSSSIPTQRENPLRLGSLPLLVRKRKRAETTRTAKGIVRGTETESVTETGTGRTKIETEKCPIIKTETGTGRAMSNRRRYQRNLPTQTARKRQVPGRENTPPRNGVIPPTARTRAGKMSIIPGTGAPLPRGNRSRIATQCLPPRRRILLRLSAVDTARMTEGTDSSTTKKGELFAGGRRRLRDPPARRGNSKIPLPKAAAARRRKTSLALKGSLLRRNLRRKKM